MSNKRRFNWNIGTVIFGALFLYLVITLIIYLTTEHITSYLVTYGTISTNETYTALVLRTEETVTANADGYLTYLLPESSKAAAGEKVALISDTAGTTVTADLDSEELENIRSIASTFSKGYDGTDFDSVYDFKASLNSEMLQSGTNEGLSGTYISAVDDGIVAYSYDGYESLTVDTFEEDDLNSKTYHSTTVSNAEQVSAGDTVFRLITETKWSIVFAISDRQYANLSSTEVISVKFNKDDNQERGNLSLFEKNGTYYAQITFYSGVVRYCNDRYLDIELITSTETGLKIPTSAVVTKEFYTIPTTFLTYGGEDGDAGFLKRVTNSDGSTTTSFVETELYEEVESEDGTSSVYYVDMSDFEKGDVIIHPDSADTYTIGATAELNGVYSINRGYAMFRKISIIDQNEEYCLVETGTTYGISQYDYIVKDGSTVNEDDILY